MFKLVLLGCIIAGAAANFLEDPKCPPAQAASSCAGRRSTCWSPGVRDTDCPGHGLCCFDGCANTCVGQAAPQPSYQSPVVQHPPKKPAYPAYPPPVNNYVPPEPKPTHPPPPKPTPAPAYAPPQDYGPPPVVAPVQNYGPPPVVAPVESYGPPPEAPREDYGPPHHIASPSVQVIQINFENRQTLKQYLFKSFF